MIGSKGHDLAMLEELQEFQVKRSNSHHQLGVNTLRSNIIVYTA